MKRLFVCLMIGLAAAVGTAEMLDAKTKRALNKRRVESRKQIEINGTNYWVISFTRGGKPDGVRTNRVLNIKGAKQNNPLANMVQEWKRKHAELSARYAESTNDMARVWADYHMATNMNAVTRERLEAARDRAMLPATKAVLQKIIDAFYTNGAK